MRRRVHQGFISLRGITLRVFGIDYLRHVFGDRVKVQPCSRNPLAQTGLGRELMRKFLLACHPGRVRLRRLRQRIVPLQGRQFLLCPVFVD